MSRIIGLREFIHEAEVRRSQAYWSMLEEKKKQRRKKKEEDGDV